MSRDDLKSLLKEVLSELQTEGHQTCSIFTTVESQVAVKQIMKLATPQNIQAVEDILIKYKETRRSFWFLVKLFFAALIFYVTFEMSSSGFLSKVFNRIGK